MRMLICLYSPSTWPATKRIEIQSVSILFAFIRYAQMFKCLNVRICVALLFLLVHHRCMFRFVLICSRFSKVVVVVFFLLCYSFRVVSFICMRSCFGVFFSSLLLFVFVSIFVQQLSTIHDNFCY